MERVMCRAIPFILLLMTSGSVSFSQEKADDILGEYTLQSAKRGNIKLVQEPLKLEVKIGKDTVTFVSADTKEKESIRYALTSPKEGWIDFSIPDQKSPIKGLLEKKSNLVTLWLAPLGMQRPEGRKAGENVTVLVLKRKPE